jgi:hypothetical protein
MRVTHDMGILDLAIFLEGLDELVITDARGDASDKEIRSRVLGARIGNVAAIVGRRTACGCQFLTS